MSRIIKSKFNKERVVPPLLAKNEAQKLALQAFAQKQIVILSGSAGTGKSTLMCWWAAKLWRTGQVDTIIITRPYQPLGKDIGAVPGSSFEKLLPYCMPMLMKFKEYLGVNVLKNSLVTSDVDFLFRTLSGIHIVPIEKIQGMSFNERTIILLDEAQSTTMSQMKAATTRLETGCQLIIAGDKVQTSLNQRNGLEMIENILINHPHEDSRIVRFTPADNCRAGISGWLADIYEQQDKW